MKLSQYTLDLLKDIEERIIPEVEEDYVDQWKNFWYGDITEKIFTPKRKVVSESKIEVKQFNINDAIDDYEIMLDMQLADISKALSSNAALGIRANYGTGIMSSLFGAEFFMMPRELNTLPITHSFNDTDVIRRLVNEGKPNLENALGKKVYDFGEMCLEIFRNYPKIAKYVFVYHPDTQGPLDIAELLWGSEMFYSLYDDPDLVHQFLQLITDTYVDFLDRWFKMYPNRQDINVHWNYWIKGGICLRNDSAINLSPEQYSEFGLKYDKYLFDRYDGGLLHYCGKGDHFIGIAAANTKLTGINLSQPHLNEMDKVYDAAASNNKKILNLARAVSNEYAKRPDSKSGMIFSW